MKKYFIAKGIKIIVFFAAMVALGSLFVMLLWNWLLPDLLGAAPITWLQALGLIALSRILFGRWGGRGGGRGRRRGPKQGQWKQRMRERFEEMSPEERERFKARFRGRCGDAGWFDEQVRDQVNFQPKEQPEAPSEAS